MMNLWEVWHFLYHLSGVLKARLPLPPTYASQKKVIRSHSEHSFSLYFRNAIATELHFLKFLHFDMEELGFFLLTLY